jgi:DNA-binding transcriptional ArsR family regulator
MGSFGAAKRSETDVSIRRSEVARRFANKESVRQIASAIGVSKSTVSSDLKAIRDNVRAAAADDYVEGRNWLVKQLRGVCSRAIGSFDKSTEDGSGAPGKVPGEHEFLGKAISALREIGRLIGAYEQPEEGLAQINIEHVDQVNQQSNQVTIVVLEDESWYGHNDAHTKAAKAIAAPDTGAAISGQIQSGGMRQAMGENGHGPANGDTGPRPAAGGDEGGN